MGLPSSDDMGNSEVGHNALGAGKIYAQGAKLVDINIANGQIYKDAGWQYVKPAFTGNTLHFIGLLSSGGVHSRVNQLAAMIKQAAVEGAKNIRCHVLLDGRDVPDDTGLGYVEELETFLREVEASHGCDAKIASGGGRMKVTMDRYEAEWDMVERGWHAHVLGEAPCKKSSAVEAVKELKADGTSDQHLGSFVVTDTSGTPIGPVKDSDAVVIFNFRSDRVIELSKAFEGGADFDKFDRVRVPKDVKFVGLMQYDGDLKLPSNYLVPPPAIAQTSGEYLCANGIRTFACSETQKFGHVTFFWNGNRSGYFDESLETYVEIPSDRCVFNEKPKMKAREITDASIAAIKSGRYDYLRVNYANPDMVGHTGDLEATKVAVEECDTCLGELLQAVNEVNGVFLVTSDHGNADDMVQRAKKTGAPVRDAKGKPLPLTSHTLAPVPVAIGGYGLADAVVFDPPEGAGLANVTGTIINLLGFAAPADYEQSLIKAM